jgi:hypothetical protein
VVEERKEYVLTEVFDLLSPRWTAELLKDYGNPVRNDSGVVLDQATPRIGISLDALPKELHRGVPRGAWRGRVVRGAWGRGVGDAVSPLGRAAHDRGRFVRRAPGKGKLAERVHADGAK